jgi:polysaccharide export outer membrane protein
MTRRIREGSHPLASHARTPIRGLQNSGLLLLCLALVSCFRMTPPTTPTAVNPETFPQPIPIMATAVDGLPELPPPPSENSTFTMVNGVPQYRIGPGDVLDLLVTRGPTQEKLTATVRSNGKIHVILVEVGVDGLTTEQAAREITKELMAFFRSPFVEVQVKEFNSKKARVAGAIGAITRMSGSAIPLSGRTTLLEIIGKAGGFHTSANLERVRVIRADGKTYSVNVFKYIQEHSEIVEFVLDAGDSVIVPEQTKGGDERRVFLLGEVRTPGPVPLIPRMTMTQLVAQVGGWTENALFEEAAIVRTGPANTEIITVNLRRLMLDGDWRIDQFLHPNDIVYIPRTSIGNWNAFLATLRPTLEFLSLPFQPVFTIKALGSKD